MRERYVPNFSSNAAKVSSRASEFCSQRVWKCRPSTPSKRSGRKFFSVTPKREPGAQGS